MKQELIDYVLENAEDVADLAKVDTIKKAERGDPWAAKCYQDLKDRYLNDCQQAQMAADFDAIFSA